MLDPTKGFPHPPNEKVCDLYRMIANYASCEISLILYHHGALEIRNFRVDSAQKAMMLWGFHIIDRFLLASISHTVNYARLD